MFTQERFDTLKAKHESNRPKLLAEKKERDEKKRAAKRARASSSSSATEEGEEGEETAEGGALSDTRARL